MPVQENTGRAVAGSPTEAGQRFLVSSSPHIQEGTRIADIIRLVIIALAPSALFSVYLFGLRALLTIVVSVGSAVLFEAAWQRISRKPVTIGNLSAALTGLLLALNLPPTSPWWMILVGSFFAIIIAKQFYGGLGHNVFNPALVGRVVLLIAFPAQMTAAWVAPSAWGMSAVTTATPLGKAREALLSTGRIDVHLTGHMVRDLLIGNRAGSLGEVSVVLLAAGGIFLIARRIITWHIPVSFIATVWAVTGIFHVVNPHRYADPSFHVITGGLFLGAFFMATDYVTSPIHPWGKIVFGVGCGVVTVVIRLFGTYPEGVSFAILLMNACTPLIDRYLKPAVFGARNVKAAGAA
jgi:Na+-translocating ferredoxin:NAD+ oxidoreductase subunit D